MNTLILGSGAREHAHPFFARAAARGMPLWRISAPSTTPTALLRLRVSDLDLAIRTLEGKQVPVVSTGGVPVTLAGANGSQRFAMMRLPDNLFLQLVQAVPRPPAAN